MKVVDRFTGDAIDLPSNVVPGRYRLLAATVMNDELHLQPGTVLLSDGSDSCRLGSSECVFVQPQLSEARNAETELIISALHTLSQMVREGKEAGLSPLLPDAVGRLAELNDFDNAINELLWHLHEIDRRPRFSMHYEEERTPLSRAKRIAPSALTRLAAHSEDWQRRTLSGVQPKRIWALYSDDEWAIYENRVYVSLLRRLRHYLKDREAEIRELQKKYSEALNLSKSEHFYPRLRETLCRMWADALSVEDTGRLLDTTQRSWKVLNDLLKQVRTLQYGALSRKLPHNAGVPEQLRNTNILLYDQHYRHLRTLWRAYQQRNATKPTTPDAIWRRNQNVLDDYITYIGMLVRRALSEIKLLQTKSGPPLGQFSFAGREGDLRFDGDAWVLEFEQRRLRLVPALFPQADIPSWDANAEKSVPVFMFPAPVPPAVAGDASHIGFVVNPLEFFGLENIKRLVESFLWSAVFAAYGRPITKIPRMALMWLQEQHIGKVVAQSVILSQPLAPAERQALKDWLPSAPMNDVTRTEIAHQVNGLEALGACRACGEPAHFEDREGGFRVRCDGCGTESGLWKEKGIRKGLLSVVKMNHPSGETCGSWHLELVLPD